MASIVLYIEGTTHLENGDLRRAFHLFLEKEMKGRMPRIVMGDGKGQTIDKFHTTPLKQNEARLDKVKVPQTQIMAIDNPSDCLYSIYKGNGKVYHKVIDFCKVFPKLDTKAVITTFNDFKRLLEEMNKAILR